MVYLHEEEAYKKDRVFSQDDLAALTPNGIKRWMWCEKAYGTPKPGPNDHPTSCRSSQESCSPERNEGKFYLDELERNESGDGGGKNGGAIGGARQPTNEREWLQQAIFSQIASLRRGLLEAQSTILERIETQRAQQCSQIFVKIPDSPWCGMLLQYCRSSRRC
jgi:hypothetical protein